MLKSDQNMFFLISVSPFLWNRFQNLFYLNSIKTASIGKVNWNIQRIQHTVFICFYLKYSFK